MIIEMKTTACGPNGNFYPGHRSNVDDETGKRFVEGGYATEFEVKEPKKAKLKVAPGIEDGPANADVLAKKPKE